MEIMERIFKLEGEIIRERPNYRMVKLKDVPSGREFIFRFDKDGSAYCYQNQRYIAIAEGVADEIKALAGQALGYVALSKKPEPIYEIHYD